MSLSTLTSTKPVNQEPWTPVEWSKMAVQKQKDWVNYDQDQGAREAFDALPWWQKIGKDAPDAASQPIGERPPDRMNFESEDEYYAAMEQWARTIQDQDWKNQSAFRADAWDSRMAPMADAAGNDLLNARKVQDRRQANAWDLVGEMGQSVDDRTAKMEGKINEAFGGGIGNRLGQIDNARDQALQAANTSYQDVVSRFDQLGQMRTQAISGSRAD